MKFNADYLPEGKLSKSPLVEAIIEIRFEPNVPPDAMFGIFYKPMSQRYPKVEQLPVLQAPPAARERDPNLRFKPYYKFTNDNFCFQLGARTLILAQGTNYQSWENFLNEFKNIFSLAQELGIIKSVHRVGLRYINFFEGLDIFSKSKLFVVYENAKVGEGQGLTRLEFKEGDFKKVINLSNNSVQSKPNPGNDLDKPTHDIRPGSVIDIDVFIESMQNINTDMTGKLDSAHSIAHQTFFGVLNEDFTRTLV